VTPETLATELIFTVPGVSCSHCESAITEEVGRVQAAVREAIEQVGYDVEP
jgi:copper chaperone CopZ